MHDGARGKARNSLLAIGMGLTLVPVVTASAAVEASPICKAYNADVKLQSKATAGLAKEMASGKWSSIQKERSPSSAVTQVPGRISRHCSAVRRPR